MKITYLRSVAVLAAMAFGGTSVANAETPAEFYKGKTVKIIFGFGVGGTYGKYSQLIAQYLAPQIGAETIITQSMPGAGGIKSSNFAYNVAPKDGLTLFMPPDTVVISELLQPTAVKYKSVDFQWLGTAVQSNSVMVLRSDAGITKPEDLKTKEVIMGSTGKGSQTFLMPMLANGVYDAKYKIVSGYKGSQKAQLAMEQGEVQGVALTWLSWKSAHEAWLKSGFAVPVLQIGNRKEADLPNVPSLSDLVTGEDRKIVNFMATMSPIGRGLVAPPGVDADKVAFLRTAFMKMLDDPALKADAEKRKLRIQGASGEEIQKLVGDSMDISEATVGRAREIIFGNK